MRGYERKSIFKDTFSKLQKELHYTKREMYKKFPDLAKEMDEEEINNMLREHYVFLAKIDKNII